MSDSQSTGRQWILRLQSAFVLPLARGIYLLVALACLLTAIGGVLFVAFLQASAAGQPSMEPLPPPYQATSAIPSRDLDLTLIEERLADPAGLQFVVTLDTITAPLTTRTVLGHFQVSTLNALAGFPDGVSLLGGRDAHFFERVPTANRQRIGLAPRPALLAEIEQTLQGLTEQRTRTFEIQALARDEYGIASGPIDLSFDLTFAPPPTARAEVLNPIPEQEQKLTELQKIARAIAQTLEPSVTPAQFDAYRAALQVPSRCGAGDDDVSFLAQYRQAFEQVKPRISPTTIEAFYNGLCEAWDAVLQREAAQQQSARRAAGEARAEAEARNRQAISEHQAKVARAEALTTATLSVIGGALGLFLSVALILAFLALEGHSRAMRAAVESMVKLTEQRETRTDQEGSA